MGKLEGKVAFITGAARGQGRSHAVRLAEEGADIIGIDICDQIASVPYPMATPEDLAETARAVEALGRRIVTFKADVRDFDGLQRAFDEGVNKLGPVTIVLANAGIAPMTVRPIRQEWQDVLDVNLTGTYHTLEVVVPSMIANGLGGSIVLTSSTAGLTGVGSHTPGGLGYNASKHGMVGLMRAYANYLGKDNIRVNTVHPTALPTPMVMNEAMQEFIESAQMDGSSFAHLLPVEMVEAIDISNAIAWLVSDEARYVTGVALPVDAGFVARV